MKQFKSPKASLGDLDAATSASVITAAADVALILDPKGVIRDLAFDRAEFSGQGVETWLGRPWLDTVTIESRPKIEALLQDAAAGGRPRWRHVNHPAPEQADLPILYTAVEVRPKQRLVAIGRDLRSIASLQQQLVDAQQAIERDYLQMRNVETRYRLIFQSTSDPVLIVDALSRRVNEANPAAVDLLGIPHKRLVGSRLGDAFDPSSAQRVDSALGEAQASGRRQDAEVKLARGPVEAALSVMPLRQGRSWVLVISLDPAIREQVPTGSSASRLLKVLEAAPDAIVVTDPDGTILSANRAFVDLTQLPSEQQAEGRPLERWLGQPGMDFSVLLGSLRQHGSLRLLSTVLRSDHGLVARVEISAVTVTNGGSPCFGFLIRDVGRRLSTDVTPTKPMHRSVEQLTELVGQMPLKELVRETTDIIERLCIEAALQLSGDNRASAAEMLGLSRQSLYVKLRRYGLGDLAADGEP